MFHLTSLFIVFSIFQLSQALTEFHFNTTAICQNFNKVWCVRAFHLQFNTFAHENLGITDRFCFNGSASLPFEYTSYLTRNDKGIYRAHFEVHVGFRHNCTYDGAIVDYQAKQPNVQVTERYVNIPTEEVINDQGDRGLLHLYQIHLSWEKNRFRDIKIDEETFYLPEYLQ